MSTPTEPDERHAAQDALRHATQLEHQGRVATRWYARYLFAFGLASLVMATAFGVVGGFWGSAVLTPLWLIFLTGLTVYSARQRTAVRGMTRIHGFTIAAWAVAWGVTVTVGTHFFPDRLWWWVLGGLAMATPPLVAARIVLRGSAPVGSGR